MKVNQIVGEHKKGFRAKKYSFKPKSYIEPIKVHGPKSPEDQRKEMKEADTTIKQYEPGKSVTVDDPMTGVSTTVDLTKSPGALRPNDKGELELDSTPNAGGPMGATTTQPQAPKIAPGTKVTMAKDDTAAAEGMFGFGNKSPEEWAKTSPQMAKLLQFREKYKGTQYEQQVEKRIQMLKDRLDLAGEPGAGMGAPVDSSGNLKPVVPPEQFDTRQLKEDDALLNKMLTIAGLR